MKPAAPSKRVLITGIEGFTGIHLRARLEAAGYDVYGTTLKATGRPDEFPCDIRNTSALEAIVRKVEPAYIIHLAALAFTAEEDSRALYEVNVLGSEALLQAALKLLRRPEKVIMVSSATVYGPQDAHVLEESMCPRPVQHYGISKLAMERIAETYLDRLPLLIVRPFNYTGPGQSERFVVPKIVTHFRERRPVIQLGNIDVKREFNDVRYVTECYRRLLESECSEGIFNLASGRPIPLRRVVEELEELTGHRMEIRVDPALVRPNEIPSLSGSVERLKEAIDLPELPPLSRTLKRMLGEEMEG